MEQAKRTLTKASPLKRKKNTLSWLLRSCEGNANKLAQDLVNPKIVGIAGASLEVNEISDTNDFKVKSRHSPKQLPAALALAIPRVYTKSERPSNYKNSSNVF